MYAFLLVLGAVITAAGLALVASGVSIQDHVFDSASVIPGTIAVIGGCVLIGLGLVVRGLLRVEQALMMRPISRPVRLGETSGSIAATARSSELASIPFPPRPKPAPQPQPGPQTMVAATLAEQAAQEALPGDVSTVDRLENAPMVEETEVSLLPKPPAPLDDENGEVNHGYANGRLNGAAPAKTARRAVAAARPVRAPQQPKGSIFDSLWPKAQRVAPVARAAPAPQMIPMQPAPVPVLQPRPQSQPQVQPAEVREPAADTLAAAVQQASPPAVTILKSGVVEGMAYTLYSDGSIEAQLPQGTVRFGSITELRSHIEQTT
jgi:hypothetical protein